MADVAGVVTQVAAWFLEPILRQIRYVRKYKSNVKELKKQDEKLKARKDKVQIAVGKAWTRGDEIHEEVELWLNNVNEFTAEATQVMTEFNKVTQDISNDDGAEKMKKSCFKSLATRLDLKTRHSLGKKSVKLVTDCETLLKDSETLLKDNELEKISYRAPPQRWNSSHIRACQPFDSRELIFNDIMAELKGNKANKLGVYGMGGIGKTTLVHKVAAQAELDGLFDKVVMVEVNQNPEIRKVQDEIAEQLGLELKEKILDLRASILRKSLKRNKRVLIVLDNLWNELKLDQVGIHLGEERVSLRPTEEQGKAGEDNHWTCKILLTCRDLKVCENMKTEMNFLLEALSSEEAMDLFSETLDNSANWSKFEPVGNQIVEKCGGLPLAIAAIAKLLKNRAVSYWDNVLNQLKASNIKDVDNSVYSVIKLSYDSLRDEAKSLFLLCGLKPVSDSIHVSSLVRYGTGLGLFENVNTMKERRERVDALIEDLKAASLLLDGKTRTVKMHDVVHAVAITIAAEKLMFNMHNVANVKEEVEKLKYKNSTAISLPDYGNTRVLPERLGCLGLNFFLLFSNDKSLQIPDMLFEGMDELKVLDMTGLSLHSLPLSLCNITSLHTLCLDYCLLGDTTMIGKLRKLTILSFRGSDIEFVPQQIGQLTQLKSLDLGRCSKLKVIAPSVLSRLSLLEELYVDENFVHWEASGQNNASLAELKELSDLTTLHIHVNDAKTLPEDSFFEKLEIYNILIGDVWDSCDVSETLRTMKVKLDDKNSLGCEIAMLLKATQSLYLDELNGFGSVYPELCWEGFLQLEHLHLQNDRHISHIIGKEHLGASKVFPKLKSLLLSNLINLRGIHHNQLKDEYFSNLKILKVEKCDKLKHLFSLSSAKIFSQLQEIEVKFCKNIEEIVGLEGEEDIRISKIECSELQTLTLKSLPSFIGFSLANNNKRFEEIIPADEHADFRTLLGKQASFPNLKNLHLSSLNIESIWFHSFPVKSSFGRTLTSLVVEECCNLIYLFSFSMVGILEQLERLEICKCESMRLIIDSKGLGGENKITQMRLSKLRYLKLEGLPKLTRFSRGSSIEFPSLKELQIESCLHLKTFFSDSTYVGVAPLLDEKVILPRLDNLTVSSVSCNNIWPTQSSVTPSCIQNITHLSIKRCDNMKYLFSSSMVKSLEQLKWLYISNCTIMEEVVVTEAERMSGILFPSLTKINLEDLPQLRRFCSFTGDTFELPLFSLWIENCPNMETFISSSLFKDITLSKECAESNSEENIRSLFDEKIRLPNLENLLIMNVGNLRKIWDNRYDINLLYKLRKLRVGFCDRLLNIFPYHMLGSLRKLELMFICKCHLLEHIYEKHESSCMMEQVNEVAPKLFYPQLADLLLAGLPRLKSLHPGLHSSKWPALKVLEVYHNNPVKTYCSEYDSLEESNRKSQKEIPIDEQLPLFIVDKVAFPKLEEFTVELNDSVPQIFDGMYEPIQLSKLKVLRVTSNPYNYSASPSCVIPVLPNLETLEVFDAPFEELLLFDEHDCQDQPEGTRFRLKYLKLTGLRKLVHLCKKNSQPSQVFQTLTTLEVSKCIRLTTLVPSSVSFQKLMTLEISWCHGLINLVTISTAKSLAQLIRMSIAHSFCMEEVIRHVGDEEREHIVFDKLEYLQLHDLSSLTSFCSGSYSFKFPSLKQVIVSGCPNMKMFCQGVLTTPKLRGVQTTEEEDEGCWEGDLNTTIRHLFQTMVGFHDVERLRPSRFPQLKEIWNGQIPVSLFRKLKYLTVDEFADISWAIQDNLLPFLKSLEYLCVDNCGVVEEVFHLEELNTGHSGLLSQLGYFRLTELPRLRSIWNISHLKILGFENLKILYIRKCDSLRHILTTTMIMSLMQLEEVTVKDCAMVEEIIMEDRDNDAVMKNITIPQLNSIILESLPNLKSFYSESNVLECPSLKTITLIDCPQIKAFVFTSKEDVGFLNPPDEKVAFPKLEEFTVELNDSMPQIFDGMYEPIQLSKLKVLRVTSNPYNYSASPSCVIPVLPNLETLEVFDAPFEELLLFDEHDCQDQPEGTPIKLKNLELIELTELVHFCKDNSQPSQVFQTLVTLKVSDCESLKTLVPSSVSFQNLMTLEISWCYGLINLVTISTAKSLTQLTRMSIANSFKMEEVIRHVGDEVIEHIVFDKLEYLQLHELSSLTSFCSGSYSFKFPSLKQVVVSGCPNMKMFCQGVLTAPKLRGVRTTEKEDEGCWEGDLNTTIRHLFQTMVGFHDLERLRLSRFPQLKEIWNGQIPVSFFRNLKRLTIDEFADILWVIQDNILPFLKSLEYLCVDNCGMVEEVFHLEELNTGHSGLLSQLGYFGLIELPRLRSIWNISHLKILGFENLKILYIHKCDSLRHILTATMIMSLMQLEEVTVKDCAMVEEIIMEDRGDDAVMKNITIPQLNSILLESLPNLKSFYSESNNVLEYPSLKTITLMDCSQIKTFVFTSTEDVDFLNPPLFDEKVVFPNLQKLKLSKMPGLVHLWNEINKAFQNLETLEISECGSLKSLLPSSASFQKLMTLEVSKCDGLKSLVRFPTAKTLEQLTRIDIADCKMMEEIVIHAGDEEIDRVSFSKLKYLGLHCLPSLTGFYLGNYVIELPVLERVVVRQCPKMITFSKGEVSTPKLQRILKAESDDEGRWEDNLNCTIQQLSEETALQRSQNGQSREED